MNDSSDVQRVGGVAVLVQGSAVHDVAHLIRLGLRYREQVHGTAPSVHHRRLLAVFADMAGTDSPLNVRDDGHSDVRGGTDRSQFSGIGWYDGGGADARNHLPAPVLATLSPPRIWGVARRPGCVSVAEATEASICAAKHLSPMDSGAVEALRVLAVKLNELDESGSSTT